MKTPIEHFYDFVKVQRCSYKSAPMMEYIINFGKKLGCEVVIDKVNNILFRKGNPKICLQAHYDMVCLGDAPNIETTIEDGWLKAKNSTLGADDGIGVAIAFSMIEKYNNLECLFTSEEEVGMIGANNLDIELKSKYLLNLDSEHEGLIVVGCAGGINIFGELNLIKKDAPKDRKIYKISVSGLPGGHSGLKIHEDIPNAIKVLVGELIKIDCEISYFDGGEASNSIPKNSYAIILVKNMPKIQNPLVQIEELEENVDEIFIQKDNILGFINAFAQGVRSFNQDLGMPNDSINLSTVKIQNEKLIIDCFGRSMSIEGIERLKSETTSLYKAFGFNVSYKDRIIPWKPTVSDFTNLIKTVASKFWKEVNIKGIHAGLECGVIQSRQKHHIDVASIGPNIENAHTIEEKCNLESLETVCKIVDELLCKLQK